MNKRQENKLTMYEGLLTLLQENSEKIQSIGGFGDAVTEFNGTVAELKTKSIDVDGISAGKTSDKHSAEDALVECLLPVCSALYVFGRKQNNAEIKERVNINETKLHRMRDTELASFGIAVAAIADANLKGVALFGLTENQVAALKTKAEAYSASIGARESSVAGRIGVRESMNNLFDKADEILSEEIDRYMEMLRQSETEFYNKYFSARVVKYTGVRHRAKDAAGAAAK